MTGPIIARGLGLMRRDAQSRMTSTIQIVAAGGTISAPDPTTGRVTDPTTTVYAGPARIRAEAQASTDVDAGERRRSATRYIVFVPAGTPGVKRGHTVKVTACPDPQLVTTRLQVVSVELGDQVTARRITCEVISS